MNERKLIANEMARTEVTDKVCDIHHEKLLKHPFSKNLFCPECTKERIAKDAEELEKANSKDASRYNFFYRYSSQYLGKTDERQETDVIKFIDGYMDNITEGYGNIIISGPAGVGKSFASYDFAKRLNRKFYDEDIDKTVLFMSTTTLMNGIRATFAGISNETEKSILDRIIGADVLILDDLGKESSLGSGIQESSNWTQRILFEIFDKRNRTIVSTNMSSKELKQLYDAALYDRILSGAKGNIFSFKEDTSSLRR